MGIPYSKQINSAFDQVTPLVAAGFEVLQTTKNISVLLAAVQVITAILLFFILGALLAILVSINPDLENERRSLITPTVKWFACWLMPECEVRSRFGVILTAVAGILFAAGWAIYSHATDVKDIAADQAVEHEGADQINGDGAGSKDEKKDAK